MTAATPGRDELREQIAAAAVTKLRDVMDMPWDRCPHHMLIRGRILADAVMEPVGAWVAAHAAEVAALRAKAQERDEDTTEMLLPLVTYLCDNHADRYGGNHCIDVAIDLLTESAAAVARVRALCDDAAAESRSHDARTHDTTPYIPVAAVRAVLPPRDPSAPPAESLTTEQTRGSE